MREMEGLGALVQGRGYCDRCIDVVVFYECINMIDEDENIEDEEKEKKLGVSGTS